MNLVREITINMHKENGETLPIKEITIEKLKAGHEKEMKCKTNIISKDFPWK